MKKQNKKRGFTIVELTIVVSVIAILSAVLIPTFAGVIKSAKRSADQQAVTTINRVLAGEIADEPETISDVITMMAENGYDVEDYKPLTKDTYFFWVKSQNAIIIADDENNVLYPAAYESLTYTMGDWYVLTGEIKEDNSWKETDGTVAITSGAQFVSLMNNINEGKKASKDVTTITISQDIDVQGSTVNFGTVATGEALTIEGNGKTIYGLRSDENNTVGTGDMEGKGYGYGMLPEVNGTVTVSNIVIDGMIVEDTTNDNTGIMGFIAGTVNGTLNLENVTVKNSSISGSQKVGALVGYAVKGAVNMKNVTVENVSVKGEYEVAQLIGVVQAGASVTAENVTVTNVTTAYRNAAGNTMFEVSAPTVDGINAEDKFVSSKGWNGTALENFIMAGITNNWYWYGIPADQLPTRMDKEGGTRNYNNYVWSASTNKTAN